MFHFCSSVALVREENDCYSGVGPLSYPDYKPSMHSSFDQKYMERVQRFVRQGLLGDAAAVLPVPGHAAETHAHLNTGLTSNVYSHLLKESSMHVRVEHCAMGCALRCGCRTVCAFLTACVLFASIRMFPFCFPEMSPIEA